mmetsp:Transcript_11112/g.51478  ORF Transcript_11112/g.51478 Transcript_11112/m.51478 type:complete len:324 (-) Transcript_11112:1481-2452(-)
MSPAALAAMGGGMAPEGSGGRLTFSANSPAAPSATAAVDAAHADSRRCAPQHSASQSLSAPAPAPSSSSDDIPSVSWSSASAARHSLRHIAMKRAGPPGSSARAKSALALPTSPARVASLAASRYSGAGSTPNAALNAATLASPSTSVSLNAGFVSGVPVTQYPKPRAAAASMARRSRLAPSLPPAFSDARENAAASPGPADAPMSPRNTAPTDGSAGRHSSIAPDIQTAHPSSVDPGLASGPGPVGGMSALGTPPLDDSTISCSATSGVSPVCSVVVTPPGCSPPSFRRAMTVSRARRPTTPLSANTNRLVTRTDTVPRGTT